MLDRAVRNWFARGDVSSLHLTLADRQTLFAFHWAAMQMPADSVCFSDIDSDRCEKELGYWLTKVRGSDPRFIAAYRQAEMRLNLPPAIK
jgi:hypothetical protein